MQGLEPSLAAFPGTLVGIWIKGRVTRTHAVMWDAPMASRNLTHCSTMHTPLFTDGSLRMKEKLPFPYVILKKIRMMDL